MTASQQGKLFFSFLRIGLLGFGGGPSMIPLVHQEVVKRHAWMKDEEFADVLAIANTLPGPIATKMPGYIGFRVGGTLGCINAVLAVILPMIVAMILLLGLFSRHRDVAWIHGMSQGMVPVVMVMMGQLAWDFLNKSRLALGWAVSLVMAAVAGVLIYWLGVHPGLVIGALLVAAMLPPLTKRKSVEEAAQ
ncbi:chromate transporter [Billgrantia desiderata]|uniref:Chromate transporter n=1 Tax=Billgrantia desiderata TaxID=52021 RepID=A0AAW4YQF0_9GAMM|nr:chromate transporter [Halomonas desiderata]MCE8013037.1 chromate transporter [Halomonas desiderata]MCE8050555.1 chromate transporter [Halomonas desiderata]OUE43930.1 chromate transporter [Halomonas desiderata SP1]